MGGKPVVEMALTHAESCLRGNDRTWWPLVPSG
eukprot:COSAG01_NODE_68659_length_263_cov_0.951220_1_plen_32_part_10